MTALWAAIMDLFDNLGVGSVVKYSASNVHEQLKTAMSLVFGPDMQTLYGIFAAPALLMLMLYVCLDMLEKTSTENFSLDSIVLDFTKLIFGVALINNGLAIVEGVYGISEMICEKIITAAGEINYSINATPPSSSDSIWGVIGFFIQSITESVSAIGPIGSMGYFEMVLVGIISTICVSIIAYQRAVRIAMRLVLSPFVFADVVGNGLNTNAIHYLKVIFGLCMEGPIICASIALVAETITGSFNGLQIMFYGLTVLIVIIKLLFDSHKMAQDMFL